MRWSATSVAAAPGRHHPRIVGSDFHRVIALSQSSTLRCSGAGAVDAGRAMPRRQVAASLLHVVFIRSRLSINLFKFK